MIIVMKHGTTKEDVSHVVKKIEAKNLTPVVFEGTDSTVVHIQGDTTEEVISNWQKIKGVEKVVRIMKPYKLASREHHKEKTVIQIGDVKLGNGDFVMMAGPCSIENEDQLRRSAEILLKMGVKIMRASAFKPRTSPYSFQGMGIEGLKLLKKISDETGIMTETEVMDVRDVPIAAEYVDIIRVGARNMQNFDLLKECGKVDTPVILKRGMSATIKEFLMAAEYILANGNKNVILCERGIRTFETAYRNTLDLGAVVILNRETHLPIIVDPSHAAGDREIVPAFAKASVPAGADGLLVEMHPSPEEAMSDGAQSLYPEQLETLIQELKPICKAVGRNL